jgi:hypothetical protein
MMVFVAASGMISSMFPSSSSVYPLSIRCYIIDEDATALMGMQESRICISTRNKKV